MNRYHSHQVTSGYILLPFYSFPMWPQEWNAPKHGKPDERYDDKQHPERFATLFCVRCMRQTQVGQLAVHVVSGLLRETHQPGLTTNARLLCTQCMPPWTADVLLTADRTDVHHLSYYPFMLLAQVELDRVLDPWKSDVMAREVEWMNRTQMCVVCRRMGVTRKLRMPSNRSIPICMDTAARCLLAFYYMLLGDPQHYLTYPRMSSIERIRTLLYHLAHENVNHNHPSDYPLTNNLNARLRWEYCSTCFESMKDATATYECTVCYRVQYCSTKCANKNHLKHRAHCRPWRSLFRSDAFVVLYNRSVRFSDALVTLMRIEDALEVQGIRPGLLLVSDRKKLALKYFDCVRKHFATKLAKFRE